MTENSTQLKFPCDCISSVPTCEEPWARVAKDGMFKDGTKEMILNNLSATPQTIAQLAKNMNLAQPTIYKHITELLRHKLIRKDEVADKNYVVERYYRLNFPVVSKEDEKKYESEIQDAATQVLDLLRNAMPAMKEKFEDTEAAKDGWKFEEFAQFLFHSIQRKVRNDLEQEKILARELNGADLDFIVWASE